MQSHPIDHSSPYLNKILVPFSLSSPLKQQTSPARKRQPETWHFYRDVTAHVQHVVTWRILVPRAYDPFGLRQESRALGATISGMRHRWRQRETGWAEFGYFLNDLKTSKFTKKCMASGHRVGQRPDCHTYFFVNFDIFKCCISVKISLINIKLRNLVNLGKLFLSMWINSC